MDLKKPIELTRHAREQMNLRGASESEVRQSILEGHREPAKKGRCLFRYNFVYQQTWQGQHYAIKQVAPVVVEDQGKLVVITVYTFFF